MKTKFVISSAFVNNNSPLAVNMMFSFINFVAQGQAVNSNIIQPLGQKTVVVFLLRKKITHLNIKNYRRKAFEIAGCLCKVFVYSYQILLLHNNTASQWMCCKKSCNYYIKAFELRFIEYTFILELRKLLAVS